MAAELAIIAKLQDEASGGIRALRGEIEGLEPSSGVAARGFQSLQSVGAVSLAALSAAAAAVGTAIATSIGVAADFQDSVTLLAIAAKGAGESFDSMRAAALAVGADTSLVGVSAAGAAEAMTTLYKAGLTTGEIFGDLNGYLAGNVDLSGALRAAIDGAAASELDMAQAANLAATTLATFGSELKTTEERSAFVNMAMNNFVQAADASLASVGDLAAAMSTIGPTAAQFGFSLQDTNTALAILSTRGIAGTEAGTALKSMFNNLMSTTPKTTAALNELGVSLYNADGTMRELPQIIGDLSQALFGLNERTVVAGGRTAEQNHQLELAQKSYAQATDAIYKHEAGLKTLTDSQLAKYIDQQSAANAEIQRLEAITGTATTAVSQLTEKQRNQYIATLAGAYGMKAMATLLMEGTAGWTAMEKAIASAATIQEVARARTETFSGAMEALNGVIETIRIGIGSAFLPVLTALARAFADLAAENMTGIVDAFEAFGAALASFFDAVMGGTPLITAFTDSVAGLAEYFGAPAEKVAELRTQIEGLLTGVMNVIGPIAQAIVSFVSWKDVLVALGIAMASFLIPLIVGLAQILLPVIAVFAGLVLAIAAVRNAFETNFLGIRDLAMDLWSALQGVFEGIRALLSGDTDAAMAAFRSAWEAGWNAIVGFIQNAGAQIGTAIQGLWQSIVTWFQSVDWGALGQSLVEKFLAGMAALGQARADLWAWVLTSLTNFIQSVDWGQLGYTLMDLLVKGIVGAVGLIGVALAGIVTFIWNFITGTNWIELGVNLVSAIVEGLSSFAQGAAAALDDWRQVIFDWAGAEDWSGVAQVIIDMVSEALGDAADAIAGQLTSWRDAIFDWAGAEDWSGVATTIVEMVATSLSEAADTLAQSASTWYDAISNWAQSVDWAGIGSTIVSLVLEGLETLVDNVSSTVSSWWDAIVRFVGGIDWSEIGITIVNLVLEGLTELVDNASDAVSSWWDAFTNAVDSIDWYQIGYDIAFWIVDGTLEITTMIQEKISGWYTQFRQVTEGMTWDQIGILIVLAIVGGLIKFAERVYTVVQDWYNRISGAVSSFAGSFLTLGSNIVGGIISGIQSMAGAIADAIRGIIAGALGAGEEAAGAHSPATKFMPLGNDISAGVAVGIAQGAGAVISAIQQVANAAQVEGAKAFGEAMKAIAEGIAAALSAAMDIGSFTGAGDGFGAALESITALMKQMVDAVAGANSYGAEALAELSDFVGLAADINDLLAQTADVTDYIARWRPPSVADTTAAIQTLIGYLSMMVDGITGMNLETMLILGVLDDFLKSALQLPKLFVGVADIMSFLASWHAPSLGPVIGAINTLAGFLQAMVSAVAGANTMGLGMLAILGAFIETASGIVELIAPLAEAIKNIATFPSGGALGFVVENVKEMAIYLKAMVAAVAESNEWGALSLALLEQFVQVAGGIVELIAPLAEAIKNAASFPGGGHLNFVVANIEEMATYLQAMVSAIAKSNEWGELSLALLDEFVQVAGEIANLIAPMMEAIKNIASFRAPDWSSFISGVASIGTYMALLVGSFNEGLRYSHEALGLLDEYVAVVVTLAESTEEFIKAIELAASFRAPDWSSFISGVASIGTYMALLVGSFNEGLRYSHEALSLIGEYVDVAADIVDLVGDAIEALGLIAGYSSNTAALKPAIDSFGADLVLLVETLGAAFAAATRETTDAVASAAAFAEDAKDIVDVVEPGIDVLTALATYVSSSGVAASVQAFAADLVMVVTALGAAFAAASAEMGTAAGQAATFAEDAKDIVDVVEPGIEALTALATYVSSSGVAASVQAFAADLVMVVQALGVAFAAASAEMGTAAGQAATFAEDAKDIVDVVEPGIEALAALATYVSSAGLEGAVQTFAADLITAVLALVSAFQQAGILANQSVIEAGEMSESLEDIVSVVEPAVEAVVQLVGYTTVGGLATNARQFAADLAIVVQTLVDGLAQAGLLANQAVAEAGEMAKHIENILKVVEPALHPDKGALSLIAKYVSSGGLIQKTKQFASDLVVMTQILVTGLTESSLASGIALAKAGEMAKSLEDLFKALVAALGVFTKLSEYTSVANLASKTQQLTDDISLTATILVTGLTAAADTLGAEAVSAAHAFAQTVALMVSRVQVIVESLVAIAETKGVDGLSVKIAAFGQELATATMGLSIALAWAAAQLGQDIVTAAAQFAADAGILAAAVDAAIKALVAIAETKGVDGLSVKIAAFGHELATATMALSTTLAQAAAQLGTQIISSAVEFAGAIAALATEIFGAVTGLTAIGNIQTPDIGPKLQYITTSAQQIQQAFSATGEIGQAVVYAAVFRDNVQRLVDEVLGALAELGRLAAGDAPGSVQQVLSMMLAAFQNQAGAFAGAGSMLADNVTTGWRAADWTGSGLYAVVQIAAGAMGAMAAVTKAGDAVGDEFIAAVVGAVNGGQGQVVAAVVQVVNAAIDAGRSAAKGAAAIGQDLATFAANAAASERSAMDAAGSAVGNALIDGMARAITAGKSRLVNAIKDAVNSAVAAAKAALGIASPSRVAYELIDNFMRTAAGRFGDAGDMVAAIGRSMDATVAEGAARLARARLQPAFDTSASMARSPVLPTVMPRPATAGASTEFAGRGGAINIYGNIVLPNVSNPVSFLEELDALRGGG